MLPTYSSNVILAKARAMYGRRLTRANYRELLECRTVGEVASYLKNQTGYGSILAGILVSPARKHRKSSGATGRKIAMANQRSKRLPFSSHPQYFS